jgi:hypothetical protein
MTVSARRLLGSLVIRNYANHLSQTSGSGTPVLIELESAAGRQLLQPGSGIEDVTVSASFAAKCV